MGMRVLALTVEVLNEMGYICKFFVVYSLKRWDGRCTWHCEIRHGGTLLFGLWHIIRFRHQMRTTPSSATWRLPGHVSVWIPTDRAGDAAVFRDIIFLGDCFRWRCRWEFRGSLGGLCRWSWRWCCCFRWWFTARFTTATTFALWRCHGWPFRFLR